MQFQRNVQRGGHVNGIGLSLGAFVVPVVLVLVFSLVQVGVGQIVQILGCTCPYFSSVSFGQVQNYIVHMLYG